MDDPSLVRRLQSISNLIGVHERPIGRESATSQHIGERFPVEELHDQEFGAVLVADVEQRADVGVAQCSDRARFSIKPLPRCGISGKARRQDLNGDGPIQARVAGTIDLAHAAGTDH